jgi:hypothetical protein
VSDPKRFLVYLEADQDDQIPDPDAVRDALLAAFADVESVDVVDYDVLQMVNALRMIRGKAASIEPPTQDEMAWLLAPPTKGGAS